MNPRAAHSGLPSTAGFAHPPRNVMALGIEPGMTIADFGSGSGAYVLAMAEHTAGLGTIYAVDVQKDLLKRTHNEAIKRGFKNVNVIWGDLEKTHGSKLGDHACDLVLISNLLFQVEDKAILFREALRILRPEGRLAIVDWKESYGGLGPIQTQVVDDVAAKKLAESAGFTLSKEFPAGAHHYGLIFSVSKT